jgi:hypothetical protein
MKKLFLIILALIPISVRAQSTYNLPITWTSSGGSNFVFNVYAASGSTNFVLATSVTNTLFATVPNLPVNAPNWVYVAAFDRTTGALASAPSPTLNHYQLIAPPVPFTATTGIGSLSVNTSISIKPPTP